MRRQEDEAYVLGTWELGEADLVVTLFAREHGKVQGVARAARSSRRRFGGLLEPMTHVRAVWTEKDGRDLHRLDDFEERRSFAAMQSDPLRQAACAVLAEVTGRFAHEGQSDPDAFRLLGSVLKALEQGGRPQVLVRYFEFWMLRIHGLLPALDACALCGSELPSGRAVRGFSGVGLCCASCRPAEGGRSCALSREERSFLESIRRLPPERMPDDASAAREGGSVEALLRGSLESFAERPFRSYRHLRVLTPPEPGEGDAT